MSEKLIKSFDMKLATPECHPGSQWYRAQVELHDDISDVLPYLNAELEGCDYHHTAKVLLWKNNGKKYAFRPREIAVDPVECGDEGRGLVGDIIDTVNDIWCRRGEIKPDFEGKKPPPSVLALYKLLPGSNCRGCGFPTCMAYAAALRSDPEKASLCAYLPEEEYLTLLS
jgi:ArsR family metal-binding transcriptional regulator